MGILLQIPDDITRAMRVREPELERRLLEELAVALFAQDILGFGKARAMARLSVLGFGLLLGRRGVPRHDTPEDLDEDFAYAERG